MVEIKRYLYIGIILILILIAGCATQKVVIPAEEFEPVAEETEPEVTVKPVVEAPAEIVVAEEVDCVDSDGGKNYYVRGTVTTKDGIYVDTCNVDAQGKPLESVYPIDSVFERYCFAGVYKTKHYKCPEGCKDGVCLGTPPTS